jgi:aspartate/methionine/tyrosine aminotransferase
MRRLELINDTFLSANTPVQQALPEILAASGTMQRHIRARCRENLVRLRDTLRDSALTVLDVEAGWIALVRLPSLEGMDDVKWTETFLREEGVITQPGYLFDLDEIVPWPCAAVSLLTPENTMEIGPRALRTAVARYAG